VTEGDYAVAWTAPARRALQRHPGKIATAVIEFLYASLAANPHRVGKPLQLGLEGLHSARRGDYRVIYRIDGAAEAADGRLVGHGEVARVVVDSKRFLARAWRDRS
jgi:mRNA-degrading endonuclease RelE of RelBE toxin-antitoxin system